MGDTIMPPFEEDGQWNDEVEEASAIGQGDDFSDEDVAMGAGMWVLNDDGTFTLLEPYRTKLDEARVISTKAWTAALVAYLEENSPYTAQELVDELLRRNSEREETKTTVFEEFVLEALSGEL